jgi:two-component system, NarL family, response regulator DegU
LQELHDRGIKIVCWLQSKKDEDQVRFLFKRAFWGYFVGEVEKIEFIECLHHLKDNLPYLHSKLSSLLLKEYLSEFTSMKKIDTTSTKAQEQHNLTKREWEVLVYMARGYNNVKIGQNLELKESTVKNNVSAILRKLNVSDRTAAVVLAIKNEWIKYSPHK